MKIWFLFSDRPHYIENSRLFCTTVIQLFAWYSHIIMIHLYSVCCDKDKNDMKTGGTGIYLSQLCKSNPPHSEL